MLRKLSDHGLSLPSPLQPPDLALEAPLPPSSLALQQEGHPGSEEGREWCSHYHDVIGDTNYITMTSLLIIASTRMATSPSQGSPGASSLRQFQLHGVSDTGRIIGNGSYATVKELEFRGLKCVGKKIHQALLEDATPQERAAML